MNNPFFIEKEQNIIDDFLEKGYVVFPLEYIDLLNEIKTSVYTWGTGILQEDNIYGQDHFFDNTHDLISNKELNDFRVKMIAQIAKSPQIRSSIYLLAKPHIEWIAGNELAMQRNCNLMVHLANDNSAIFPLHSDVWSGNSPYEVVFWFPLVPCFDTKSMYILPKTDSDEVYRNFKNYSHLSASEFYEEIKDRLIFLDIPFGHGLIFSHALLHGNRLNEENETRWSFDVRFKNVISPYGNKKLGENFLPITIRPATRMGYHYKKPELL